MWVHNRPRQPVSGLRWSANPGTAVPVVTRELHRAVTNSATVLRPDRDPTRDRSRGGDRPPYRGRVLIGIVPYYIGITITGSPEELAVRTSLVAGFTGSVVGATPGPPGAIAGGVTLGTAGYVYG